MRACTSALTPFSVLAFWMRNGAPTIVPIVCRGFSDE